MAIYYTNGEKINIPISKRPFGKGSEGRLYLIEDKLYKIYNPDALNEGFGEKKIYHQALLGMNELFHKFILPESLIFDEFGNYVGYVTRLVGNKSNEKERITSLSWDKFIKNLKDIEDESNLLSEYRFLTTDIGVHNSVFSKETESLYMIDPGRYHHQAYFTIHDYAGKNRIMLEEYFLRMLESDIRNYKIVTKSKSLLLARMIEAEKGTQSYSEYFETVKEKQDSVHEFLKLKSRSLR